MEDKPSKWTLLGFLFGALFKFLAVGACWLFFFYYVSIALSVHRDMLDRNSLFRYMAALEPLQAKIAAQLEANAAASKPSPPIPPEMALEFSRLIPDPDDFVEPAGKTPKTIPYKAVLPDGVIALFHPRASALFLLRPALAEGKITWTCHAASARENILPNNCRERIPNGF